MNRKHLFLLAAGSLGGCAPVVYAPPPLGTPINGNPTPTAVIGNAESNPSVQLAFGQSQELRPVGESNGAASGGDIALDFADTDIRAVLMQILGTLLRVNYTIDPGVHGTVTLHTSTLVSRSQLLPILQTLLAQVGAAVVQTGGLYRVEAGISPTPASGAAGSVAAAPGGVTLAGTDAVSGATVIPLRFAGAEELARVLQPFIGQGGRVTPDPSRNALLISGDSVTRGTLASLVQAFDIDLLAGQSYMLLPSVSGDAKNFASALQDAFRAQGGAALAGQLRVVPMTRINAVLVVSSQPRYITDARRVYNLFERNRRETVRSWHIVSLSHSQANDITYLLQQAFTPSTVTTPPAAVGQLAPGAGSQTTGAAGRGSTLGSGGIGSGASAGGGGAGVSASSASTPAPGLAQAASGTPPSSPSQSSASANPLLGGLDPTGGSSGGGTVDTNVLRIISSPSNNTVLIYSTQREQDTIEAMLRKMDVLPLQVLIDATIAEVTLNDQLQAGTQFFFKSGGLNSVLSSAVQSTIPGRITAAALGTSLPGFIIGGPGAGGGPIAISALQAVTTVKILSSPQLLVQDQQPARLQVGSLVPYLTSSSQSTLVANSTIVNQVNYQPTGVIMQVTPRVNSGGLVTLDIYQEVSSVDNSTPAASGIDSPTFLERNVSSRIVVQDGQTVGLAGLISDSSTRGNSGIPFLKDIPLLGFLAGTQSNTRARTELLVLITPHVVHNQLDATELTDDLRAQLSEAAAIPTELSISRTSGRADPGLPIRRALRLEQ